MLKINNIYHEEYLKKLPECQKFYLFNKIDYKHYWLRLNKSFVFYSYGYGKEPFCYFHKTKNIPIGKNKLDFILNFIAREKFNKFEKSLFKILKDKGYDFD